MTLHPIKSAVLASLVLSSSAFACRYFVDESAEKARLISVAKAYLGDASAYGNVESFTYFESKPTPMCPEELTFIIRLDMYAPATGCRSIVEVTHVQPFAAGVVGPKAADRFEVNTLRQECQELED